MKQIHRIVGAVVVLAFIGTGLYMHFRYNHLRGMDSTTRMLFRSGHINLLFSGLLNLALGTSFAESEGKWPRRLQTIGSVLVLVAPVFFLYGFFNEPWQTELERPWSRLGVYGVFGGTLLSFLAGLKRAW